MTTKLNRWDGHTEQEAKERYRTRTRIKVAKWRARKMTKPEAPRIKKDWADTNQLHPRYNALSTPRVFRGNGNTQIHTLDAGEAANMKKLKDSMKDFQERCIREAAARMKAEKK